MEEKIEAADRMRDQFYKLSDQIDELLNSHEFLYDDNNQDCIPGLKKCLELIDENIYDLYKELV